MWYEWLSQAMRAYYVLDVRRCTELSDPTGELIMALLRED
jgi:hypothetical protein